MGGGVTTGSLLNQRVYSKKSGSSSNTKRGGGVQMNALIQTRVTLANRSGNGKKAGLYTSLSNQINGRKEVIYVGGQSCCGQAKMSTADKIAMYMSIAQAGVQLGQGIADIVGAFKADKSDGTTPRQTVTPDSTPKVDNGLASTLDSLGFADIEFTDVNYKEAANDFMSQMKKADNSQDLYQALQGAKAYKAQVDSRMSRINIGSLNTQLETLKGEAEGSIDMAEKKVSNADKGVRDAESNVKQGQRQVDSARDSYDAARQSVKTDNKAYNDASKAVDEKTGEYDKAGKALDTARKNYSTAQAATKECTQAWETAKLNTSQALANLNALKAQQGLGTDGVALQAQIADAQAQYDAAVQAEKSAEEAKNQAEANEAKAKDALGDDSKGAVQAFNNAKSQLATARDELKAAAEQLKNSKEITQEQYDLLTNRQESVGKAETNLETQNENLTKAKEQQATEQAKLDQLETQKDQIETQIHDYKEMQEASEKLSDLSKYETKLQDMMKKEGIERDELTKKLNERDAESNDTEGVSAKGRKKAEKKEDKLTDKLVELNAGDATDDIARDKDIQISGALDKMAELSTGIGLMGGSNKRTINGHTVEYKNNQYFVDGGTQGMDKASAEMLVKMQAFTKPKIPFA